MSEQQNTALIQALYAAFGRGDIQAIVDSCASDVDWSMEAPSIVPFAGKRKGHAEVLGFFQALAGTQHNMKLTTDSWAAQGDLVATVGRFAGTVTATGKSFDSVVAHFFTIRDGKVSKFVDVIDTAQIVQAYTGSSTAAA